jgi:hypothetical protein
MASKAQFGPHQLLVDGQWQTNGSAGPPSAG